MRLLFFTYSLTSGGAERVAANLANHWAAKEWDVTLVTLAPLDLDFYELDPRVRRIALELAGESANFLMGLYHNVCRVVALRRVLRRLRPDVAIALMNTSSVLLALASWDSPQACTIGSERTFPQQFPLNPPWELVRRTAYRRLDAVVTLTQKSAKWVSEHTSARRVPIIPNMALWPLPIQAPRIPPEKTRAAESRMLLAVGRLVDNKGFDQLLNVFSALARKHAAWQLVILGDGPERAALEAQARGAGLEGRVAFPGRVGNVGEWYEQADLYVLCSHFEGFPNTLVEAMAHGVPAVSFDCDTGPRDIIRDEIDGLLVSPGDLTCLNTALDRLMSDSTLRSRFAARASEVRERYSIEKVAGMWEALFAELR